MPEKFHSDDRQPSAAWLAMHCLSNLLESLCHFEWQFTWGTRLDFSLYALVKNMDFLEG